MTETRRALLRSIRPRDCALVTARFATPGVLRVPELARPVLHVVAAGACRVAADRAAPVDLSRRDVLFLPNGDGHRIFDGRGPSCGEERWLLQAWQHGHLSPVEHAVVNGDDSRGVRLVSAAWTPDDLERERLGRSLSGAVYLPGRLLPGLAEWLEATIHAFDTNSDADGSDTMRRRVVDRVVEIAMIEILDAHARFTEAWAHEEPGRADPRIARALARIHDEVGSDASVAALATLAGMSRASFCERFHERVGEPPGSYALRVRIRHAATWLIDDDLTPGEIATRLGYSSTGAFVRAFKRVLGATPAAWRERHRAAMPPHGRTNSR